MSHSYEVRVYYDDIDFGGIVYYANYLKYIERARSDYVRLLGIDQRLMKAEQGLVFAVIRVEADYLQAAQFDDLLEVKTDLASIGGVRFTMRQQVLRGEKLLFKAEVTVVCLAKTGRPTRIPADIRRSLSAGNF